MPENHAVETDQAALEYQLKVIEKWQRKLYKFFIDVQGAGVDRRIRLVRFRAFLENKSAFLKSLENQSAFLKITEPFRKFQENVRKEGSYRPAFLVEEAAFRSMAFMLAELAMWGVAPELVLASKAFKVGRMATRVISVAIKLAFKEAVLSPVLEMVESDLRAPALKTVTPAAPPVQVNLPQSYVQAHFDPGHVVDLCAVLPIERRPANTLDLTLEIREGAPHVQVTHGFQSEKLGDKPMSVSYGVTVHKEGVTHTAEATIQPAADTTLRAAAVFGGGAGLLSVGVSTANPVGIAVGVTLVVAGGAGYGIYKLVKKLEIKPPTGIETTGRANVKQTKILTKAIKAYEKIPNPQNKAALAQQIKRCQGLPLKKGKETLYAMDYALKQNNRPALKNPQLAMECYQSALHKTIEAINQEKELSSARLLSQQAIKDFPEHQETFRQHDATLQGAQDAQQRHEKQCQEYTVACEEGNYNKAAEVASQSSTIDAHLKNKDVRLDVAINLLKEKGVNVANQWMQDAFQGESAHVHQEKYHLFVLNALVQQSQTQQITPEILAQAQSLAALSKAQPLTKEGANFLLQVKDALWEQQIVAKMPDPALAAMTETLLSSPGLSPTEVAKCYGQLASDPALSKNKSLELYRKGLSLDPINPDLVNGTAAALLDRLYFPSALDVCETAKQQLIERIAQGKEAGDTASVEKYNADLKSIQNQADAITATELHIAQFGLTIFSQAAQLGCDYFKAPEVKKGVQLGSALVGSYISHYLRKVTPRPPMHMQLLGSGASVCATLGMAAAMTENYWDEAGQKANCKAFVSAMETMGLGLGMAVSGAGLATHLAYAKEWNAGTIASNTLGILTPAAILGKKFYFTPERNAGRAPMHLRGILLEGACDALTSIPVAVLSFGLNSEAAITSLWTGAMHQLGYGAVAAEAAGWGAAIATFVGTHAVAFAVGGAIVILVAAGVYYNHQWYANRIHNIGVKLKAGGHANRLEAERLLAEILDAKGTHKEALAYRDAVAAFVAEVNKNYKLNHAANEEHINKLHGMLKPDSEHSLFLADLTNIIYPHAPEIVAQYSERQLAQMRKAILGSRIYGPQHQEWQKTLQAYFKQGDSLKTIPPKIRNLKASTKTSLEEDKAFIEAEKKADNLAPEQRQALEGQSEAIQKDLTIIHAQMVTHEKKLTDTGLMACCDGIPALLEKNDDLPVVLMQRHQESRRALKGDAAIEIGGALLRCGLKHLPSMNEASKPLPLWPIEVIHPPRPKGNPFHQTKPVFTSDQVFFKPLKTNQPTSRSFICQSDPLILK